MNKNKILAAGGIAVSALVVMAGVSLASGPDPAPRVQSGYHSCITDANGWCTVSHGLSVKPEAVNLTPNINAGGGQFTLSTVRETWDGAEFDVRAMFTRSTPAANRQIFFSWVAYADPSISPTSTTAAPPPTTTTTTTIDTTTTTNGTTTTIPPTTTTEPPPPDPVDPIAVCGTPALNGPETAPDGATVVPAGNNANLLGAFGQAGKTWWFAPGVHTLGTGQYTQIQPGKDSTFIGAPGAILDGQMANQYAFSGTQTGVTIKHLTVRNFRSPSQEGVVNHESAYGWTLERNTFIRNNGAAVFAGNEMVIRGNCFKENQQYGLSMYKPNSPANPIDGNGPYNVLLEGNEFAGNVTASEESLGCSGCTGAMKWWHADKVTIRGNYIHHNNGVGIWADNNNNDFLIENNHLERNADVSIFLEQHYNTLVRNNLLKEETWRQGKGNSGWPQGAIYVSEAGGDARIPARYNKIEIANNKIENSWGGVTIWESSGRFCNSPWFQGFDCTLPMGGESASQCVNPGLSNLPLYWDCRWRSMNVDVHHNEFILDPSKITVGCTGRCGSNAIFSQWSTTNPYINCPSWIGEHWGVTSGERACNTGEVIGKAITYHQNNRFHNNTYVGPWKFNAVDASYHKTWNQWRAAPLNQDAGSTMTP